MRNGYIQIHRKMLDSLVFQDPYYLKLWLWLLFRARYQAGEVLVGSQVVQLEIGQLLWGRESAALELNHGLRGKNKRSISTWESYLKKLETLGKLHRNPNNHYTVISIVNYGFYQQLEREKQLQLHPQHNSNLPTNKQQTNTKNKDNNDNKEMTTLYKEIEARFGRPLSPIEGGEICHWLEKDQFSSELILLAIGVAIRNQAFSLKYVERVLRSWSGRGIRTKAQATAYLNQRQQAVNQATVTEVKELPTVPLYNWVNPENE